MCTDTALGQAYPASLRKVPKPWLVVVWMLADPCRAGTLFMAGSTLLCTVKSSRAVLHPRDYTDRQDSHPVLGGAKIPPNNSLQKL